MTQLQKINQTQIEERKNAEIAISQLKSENECLLGIQKKLEKSLSSSAEEVENLVEAKISLNKTV